jgi:hypothetical protein
MTLFPANPLSDVAVTNGCDALITAWRGRASYNNASAPVYAQVGQQGGAFDTLVWMSVFKPDQFMQANQQAHLVAFRKVVKELFNIGLN